MVNTAIVKIWGQTVGAVYWNEDTQLGYFEYAPEFIKKGYELAPLKMPIKSPQKVFSFPENRKSDQDLSTFNGLPGLLADSLPDSYGNALIDVWLARNGRPPGSMNPVEKLCFIGTRGMGALDFEPVQTPSANQSFEVEVKNLVQVASNILNQREEFSTHLSHESDQGVVDILKIGTSAGGARPKAVIAFNERTGEVRSGQAKVPKGFSQWLIKLDGVSDVQLGSTKGYGRVEMAYYDMACAAGIHMMESRLYVENGRAHFMTKRFDRGPKGERYHTQTFCALVHFDFNRARSYSYEQLFQTMRELRLPYPEAEELYRRMVFNVLARNCDDHTKNTSFIYSPENGWRLSPAYDICHAYRPDSVWASQHALSINGKRDQITLQDLLKVAKTMNIKKAKGIIQEVQKAISKFDQWAAKRGVENVLIERIKGTFPEI